MEKRKEIKTLAVDGQIYISYRDVEQWISLSRYIPREYLNVYDIELAQTQYKLRTIFQKQQLKNQSYNFFDQR